MSDEVTFDAPVAAPAKKKAAKKKSRPAPAPKQARETAPFPGLTRTACAEGCNAKGCVISQKPYCAHPTKGGLQAADLTDPAALKRQHAAREQISVRVDPNRFTGD